MNTTHVPSGFSIFGALLLAVGGLPAQDQARVTAAIAKLTPATLPETQMEALNSIATSLDPRIPAACLPLLQSPGSSVQRNAARAIGSRWWQIPHDQILLYVEALKAGLGTEHEDTRNMLHRGIGLLTRKYDGSMFSRSKSKRWVICERRGNPCLIDTQNQTEELLGPTNGFIFLPALQNGPVRGECFWHPKLDMAAMHVLIYRHTREVWVWRQQAGLRMITAAEAIKVLQPAQGTIQPSGGFYLSVKSWSDSNLDLSVEYTVQIADNFQDRIAQLRWDPKTDSLHIVTARPAR